jgi:hypothetical protein
MRNALVGLVAMCGMLVSPILFAQTAKQPPANDHAAKAQPAAQHDINGIWILAPRGRGTLGSISNTRPPMTPWGQEKFAAVRTSFNGRELANAAGVAPEKEWNDPTLQCDPTGYPRIMFQPYGQLARFVQTPNEVLEFFEWNHTWRDIWTDGRKLTEDPEPRYYGLAVGHWDGDTFVVDANGFNDRTWTDMYGSPHSDQMVLHETFHRTDHDNMEWTIALTDPKTYTKPWVSDKIMLKWTPKSTRAETEDLREDFCVWSDQEHFFKNVDSVGIGDAPTKGIK